MAAPLRGLAGAAWAAVALGLGVSCLFPPAAAGAPTVVGEIAAGSVVSCAVTTAGAGRCWGSNTYGELGIGTSTGPQSCGGSPEFPAVCSSTPVGVSGLGSGVSAIGVGTDHACARMTDGGVRCWGSAVAGKLGNGNDTGPQLCSALSFPCSTTPVAVSGLDAPASALAVGGGHACAVTDGGVECWGSQRNGSLGNGASTGHSSLPVAADLPTGVTTTAVSAGADSTCAFTDVGGVLCWGSNRYGQLGNGTSAGPEQCGSGEFGCSTAPVAVDLPTGVTATAVTIGGSHACALTSAAGVMCWGQNGDGQLGIGTDDGPETCSTLVARACSTTPVAVSGLGSGVVAISAGEDYTCALTSAGGVKCWGDNSSDQLGLGPGVDPELCGSSSCSTVPVTVTGLGDGVARVTAGRSHACALTTAGGVKCWGNNVQGGLGTGNRTASAVPLQVVGLTGAWTLSVATAGAGSGTISSTPAGIDCGGAGHTACSALFEAGSTVLLKSAAGSGLAGFAGGSCGAIASTCNVTMSSAQSVTATFALPPMASISAPARGGTYTVGQSVATSFACVEGISGPGLDSCADSGGVTGPGGGSGQLDTSTAGLHVYTVTAVSKDGLSDSASIAYLVERETEPTPGPGPGPGPDARVPTLSIRSKSAFVVGGRTKVRLDCAGGMAASACRGKLTLRSRIMSRRGKASYKTVVLGRARYTIPAGATRRVGVRLSRQALRLLERVRLNQLRAEAVVTVRGGRASRQAITVRLRRRA